MNTAAAVATRLRYLLSNVAHSGLAGGRLARVRRGRPPAAEAGWFAVSDRAYWRRSPVRPSHSVVVVSARDFELHVGRRDCRSSDCPAAPPVPTVMVASGRVEAP